MLAYIILLWVITELSAPWWVCLIFWVAVVLKVTKYIAGGVIDAILEEIIK